jgi:hypothetical protein
MNSKLKIIFLLSILPFAALNVYAIACKACNITFGFTSCSAGCETGVKIEYSPGYYECADGTVSFFECHIDGAPTNQVKKIYSTSSSAGSCPNCAWELVYQVSEMRANCYIDLTLCSQT